MNNQKKFDPDFQNEAGQGYLHRYAALGDLTAIKVITEAGANVNLPDNSGMTPMHYAAYNGHLPAVRALFNAGANPNHRAIDGQNVADSARNGEHEFIARYIERYMVR